MAQVPRLVVLRAATADDGSHRRRVTHDVTPHVVPFY